MLRKALLSTLLATALVGCGGKAFDYHPQNEIPKGPGLFSGEDGAFVLISDKKQSRPQTETAADKRPEAASFQEFREFQEFQRCKTSAKDGPEYREFHEWREWKAYRTWKERQSN